jgi:hypothetical protein
MSNDRRLICDSQSFEPVWVARSSVSTSALAQSLWKRHSHDHAKQGTERDGGPLAGASAREKTDIFLTIGLA